MCGYEFETMGGKFEPLLKMNLTTMKGKARLAIFQKFGSYFAKKLSLQICWYFTF